MTRTSILGMLAAHLLLISGCGRQHQSTEDVVSGREKAVEEETAAAPAAQPHVVQIRAVGRTFEAPAEIPSGWTTFQFGNTSSMIHFALIDVPPEGVTARVFSDELAQPFQDAMDAMVAGDEEAANAAFGRFPAWVADLERRGGPGLLSPGRIGQTTVYLEPGRYLFECYVKTDGVFHTTSPGDGRLGMLLEFTVTDEQSDAPAPVADATLAVRNSGLELVSGKLEEGLNTIRVNFLEQQSLPSFVGNDVHLLKVADEDSIDQADAWLDWRAVNGLEDPSPVDFLGGINDMPADSHGYFSAVLEPGDYAFIAEMPDPQAAGFVLPFTVGEPVD